MRLAAGGGVGRHREISAQVRGRRTLGGAVFRAGCPSIGQQVGNLHSYGVCEPPSSPCGVRCRSAHEGWAFLCKVPLASARPLWGELGQAWGRASRDSQSRRPLRPGAKRLGGGGRKAELSRPPGPVRDSAERTPVKHPLGVPGGNATENRATGRFVGHSGEKVKAQVVGVATPGRIDEQLYPS